MDTGEAGGAWALGELGEHEHCLFQEYIMFARNKAMAEGPSPPHVLEVGLFTDPCPSQGLPGIKDDQALTTD